MTSYSLLSLNDIMMHQITRASRDAPFELTMTEEDGHEDKLIQRIIDEAVKNVFGLHFDVREFRPIVDYFESGHTIETGDMIPAKALLDRIAKAPGLRKRADEVAAKFSPEPTDPEARAAAAASAAEFILEGLHVHNKLNKSAKGGATAYRR